MKSSSLWMAVGFIGQACFFARVMLQWFASERKKESVIPVSFWYFSLVGGFVLLAYAIHRRDAVFIAGQAFGSVVYTRNLWFIHQRRQKLKAEG